MLQGSPWVVSGEACIDGSKTHRASAHCCFTKDDGQFGCGYPLPSVMIAICRNCTKIPSFTSPVIINRGRPSYRDKKNFLPCPHFFLTKRKIPTMHVKLLMLPSTYCPLAANPVIPLPNFFLGNRFGDS